MTTSVLRAQARLGWYSGYSAVTKEVDGTSRTASNSTATSRSPDVRNSTRRRTFYTTYKMARLLDEFAPEKSRRVADYLGIEIMNGMNKLVHELQIEINFVAVPSRGISSSQT